MLNQEQQTAADFINGKCCVIACAGSGKTSVLINRTKILLEKQNIKPQNIFLISFNRSSRESLRERLRKEIGEIFANKVQINTFHSLGYKIILRFYGTQAKDFCIINDNKIRQIIQDICIGHQLVHSIKDIDYIGIISYISLRKNQMKKPDVNPISEQAQLERNREYINNLLAGRQDLNNQNIENTKSETMEFIYSKYEEYKKEHKMLDYDDLVFYAVDLLQQNPDFLHKINIGCKYIMVDEAQDMNNAQWELINVLSNHHNNLFIVGDPCQNIYTWRGANSKQFVEFFQSSDVEEIRLFRNYRSTNQIIALANRIMQAPSSEDRFIYTPMKSMIGDGFEPIMQSNQTSNQEADNIISFIQMRVLSIADIQYNNIAILARTNAQLMTFQMKMHQMGIPFYMKEGESPYNTDEIKIVINYLKLAYDTTDNSAFLSVCNKPQRMLGKRFIEQVSEIANNANCSYMQAITAIRFNKIHEKGATELLSIIEDIQHEINRDKPKERNPALILEYIYQRIDMDAYIRKIHGNNEVIIENIQTTLHNLALSALNFDSIDDFLQAYTALNQYCMETTKKNTGIRLSTIHQSKGLEFPVVFLIGASEGLLPHNSGDIVEERRLLYVAITRAEKELYISSIDEGPNGQPLGISSFLKGF